MEIVSQAHKIVLSILGKAKPSPSGYRLSRYCIETPVPEGVLLFNLFTRELLLLTEEEYAALTELEYLRKHWFVVPEGLDEKSGVDMVRWVRKSMDRTKHINAYTILPTTDCNARCFYCFEKGRARDAMNEETARKAAGYILDHCGGKDVTLHWFGGEPLYNLPMIDLICNLLHDGGIGLKSTMISNGYLFDDEAVRKAVECWNLKRVQITLDGKEETYNKSKAYIYREGSPYQVVLQNIARLLNAGITVKIRLNVDLHNADELMTLVDELAVRFAGKQGLYIYGHLLYSADDPTLASFSYEKLAARFDALHRLEEQISRHGLSIRNGVRQELPLHHCMADSGKALVIFPNGEIGLCDEQSESGFIGHLDQDGFDAGMVASWKEPAEQLPECADCFYYPACLRLKKCRNRCYEQHRNSHRYFTEQAMLRQYQRWQNHEHSDEQEDPDGC